MNGGFMEWHYYCIHCLSWMHVDWVLRGQPFTCPICKSYDQIPFPSQQILAYVNEHRWPKDMENAVLELKGNKCTAPGCNKNYETLDHRLPFSNGGRTSVENLFPMCEEHNLSKGDKPFSKWEYEMLYRK